MSRYLATIVLASTVSAASPTAAADVTKGARLAEQWCAHCHAISNTPAGMVQPRPPGFRAMAQTGVAREPLRSFLSRPSGAMPDLALTRSEIEDLMAYIDTFR